MPSLIGAFPEHPAPETPPCLSPAPERGSEERSTAALPSHCAPRPLRPGLCPRPVTSLWVSRLRLCSRAFGKGLSIRVTGLMDGASLRPYLREALGPRAEAPGKLMSHVPAPGRAGRSSSPTLTTGKRGEAWAQDPQGARGSHASFPGPDLTALSLSLLGQPQPLGSWDPMPVPFHRAPRATSGTQLCAGLGDSARAPRVGGPRFHSLGQPQAGGT